MYIGKKVHNITRVQTTHNLNWPTHGNKILHTCEFATVNNGYDKNTCEFVGYAQADYLEWPD